MEFMLGKDFHKGDEIEIILHSTAAISSAKDMFIKAYGLL